MAATINQTGMKAIGDNSLMACLLAMKVTETSAAERNVKPIPRRRLSTGGLPPPEKEGVTGRLRFTVDPGYSHQVTARHLMTN